MTAIAVAYPFIHTPAEERATVLPYGTITRRDAGEAQRDRLIFQKLGKIGWERLFEFRTYYTAGWGENNDGQPVSPRALDSLYLFLDALDLTTGTTPSIYLLRDGALGLAWEDAEGKDIEVTFTRKEIKFYQEVAGVESGVSHRDASELAKYLTSPVSLEKAASS